jgi:AP-3 complex subunit mu
MQTLFVVEFLHRVFDTYKAYFGDVTPKSITDNFSTAYQLLEEMLDNGYPMITEPNALNTLIAPPSIASKMASMLTGKSTVSETIGDGAMSIIPWRRTGVNYAQNEIFFDIFEEIDCIVER